jgi:hypothetical protein
MVKVALRVRLEAKPAQPPTIEKVDVPAAKLPA